MGKKEEELMSRVIDTVKKQQIEIDKLKENIGGYTEAYMEGVKDGIAFMVKKNAK